jgi:hypothetical protein
MAFCQWSTFELLPDKHRHRIEERLNDNWDTTSHYFIDAAGTIAGHLGLVNTLNHFEQSLNDPRLDNVARKSIATLVHELKPTITDPYSGMRK